MAALLQMLQATFYTYIISPDAFCTFGNCFLSYVKYTEGHFTDNTLEFYCETSTFNVAFLPGDALSSFFKT